MGKKILDSKLLYALLAIAISIGLWAYVTTVENPDGDTTLSGIPITFQNEDVLEANGLMISSGRDQTVTLKIVGPRSTLAKLEQARESISLTIDVSKITTPGAQRMAYNTSLPLGYSGSVTVTSQYPSNVEFTVSRRISKPVEVVGKFDGTLAEGFLQGEFTILPGTVDVSGVESDVEQVSYAQVTVAGDKLSTTYEGELGFALIGFQGQELKGLQVECSVDTVLVTMPVIQTAEVPLKVKLIPGGGVTGENMEQTVTCTVEPATITVSGAAKDLGALNEILLGEIDLADIIESDTRTFDIPLDPSLENISGVTRATVTVAVSGLETKALEADRIEVVNAPDGLLADPVTRSLRVLVRGPEEAIEQVSDYNVRVVADLSGFDGSVGRYTVPVEVRLDSTGDVGVVGGDYKIVVDITAD